MVARRGAGKALASLVGVLLLLAPMGPHAAAAPSAAIDMHPGVTPPLEPSTYVQKGDAIWSTLGNGYDVRATVHAMAFSGRFLYLGGDFTSAGGQPSTEHVARWDHQFGNWSNLGAGFASDGALNGPVYAMAVSGSDLYVGGDFTNVALNGAADYVARWNGTSWSSLGTSALNGPVRSLQMIGGTLYVGGDFTAADGIAGADHLAAWNGSTWSRVGSGPAPTLNGTVRAMTQFDGGLIVGGDFTNAGGMAEADHVARWADGSWSSLGSDGLGGGALNAGVYALAHSGSELYVGGAFTGAGAIASADYLAGWSGGYWFDIAGPGPGSVLNGSVHALAVAPQGMFVGGAFTNAADLPAADYLARWDLAGGWAAIGSDDGDGVLHGEVRALLVGGSSLHVGGASIMVAGIPQAEHVAVVDIGPWSPLGAWPGQHDGALKLWVYALAYANGALYVGGQFQDAAGISQADYIARWDGTSWSALGSNGAGNGALNGPVYAIAVVGNDVYVGGAYTNAGGVAGANYLARWDGSSWSGLGVVNGVSPISTDVYALAADGEALYAGGAFNDVAGLTAADKVAKWDGSSWSALGASAAGNGALRHTVRALAVQGGTLYAGGSFLDAADIPQADYLAVWDDTGWSAVGSGAGGASAITANVYAIAVQGSDVYVGGDFRDAAGQPAADRIARWNGSDWNALGSMPNGDGALSDSAVRAIVALPAGVYVAGMVYGVAGDPRAAGAVRWDGTAWWPMGDDGAGGSAITAHTWALAASADALFVGGDFINVSRNRRADRVATHPLVTQPGPVPTITGTPGDGQVSATWTSPPDTGGAEITGYSVTTSPGRHTCSTNGATSCTISGLANGTTYRLSVRAWNPAGVGPPSQSSPGVTPQEPTPPPPPPVDTTPPLVSPPTGALIAPQNLGTTARARVSWSAATDASGIKSYQLQRRKGTGSWVTVTLPSPTATSVDVPLAPNGSYRFRLRATDNASNTSAWLTVGPKTLGMLQETSTAITYSGTFRRAALTGASGGYVRHASAAGRIAKLTFSGSSVAFVTTLAKARGKAEVWLDGTKVATLDLYAATTQKKRIAWAASLTPGGHTLEIRVLGTKRAAATKATVDVDAFLVWP